MKRLTEGMFWVLLIVSAVVGPVMKARAATYYVSPTGSDSNPGTPSQPWATPGYGSRQLQPGDALIILGGRYVIQDAEGLTDVISPPSGAPGAWITIKGEAGNRPVLAGRNNTMAAVDLNDGRSYLRLENLEITHDNTVPAPQLYFRTGVTIAGARSYHIVLKDLYIHHLDDAALNIQEVDYLQVLNCRFEYCANGGIISPAPISQGNANVLIKGSRLAYMGRYYQGGDLSPFDRPDGLGLERGQGPIEIVDTVAEHNLGDGLDCKTNNTYMHNCIAANNYGNGIKLWGDKSKLENCLVYGSGDGGWSPWEGIVVRPERPEGKVFSFELVNVTVHDNPEHVTYMFQANYDVADPIIITMRNCIFANGHGNVYFGPSVTVNLENNLFWRPGHEEQVEANGTAYTGAQIEAGALGPGNVCREPKFVRPAWGRAGDYHLAGGSPGIDQGTATGAPAVDLEYRKRPLGKAFDMGAYEFNPGATVPAIFPFLLLN
jgi:hypothetical protein